MFFDTAHVRREMERHREKDRQMQNHGIENEELGAVRMSLMAVGVGAKNMFFALLADMGLRWSLPPAYAIHTAQIWTERSIYGLSSRIYGPCGPQIDVRPKICGLWAVYVIFPLEFMD